jgi:histidinol phosphatase-like PHP family hydrolase
LGDFYPSKILLQEMKLRKISVVINDDAYHANDIGANFLEAEKMLEELDYKYRFILRS